MLAYIIDMYVRTDGTYGVNEGLLASALPALVFSVLSVQPLTIVGGKASIRAHPCKESTGALTPSARARSSSATSLDSDGSDQLVQLHDVRYPARL